MTKAERAAGCGGEGCDASHPWPLHYVRHRGAFFRLCTSCVLKYHPGSFCSSCFAVLDTSPPPPQPPSAEAPPVHFPAPARPAVVHCSKCPSVAHFDCLPNPDLPSQFVCPSCKVPEGFSYFPSDKSTIDLNSAKVLLAAAKLAAASMNRAAAAAKLEAERKAKEAVLAKKRAREMIERVLSISKKEKDGNNTDLNGSGEKDLVPKPDAESYKMPKLNSSAEKPVPAAQKRAQSRERDKWMKFQEPIPTVRTSDLIIAESDKLKGASVASLHNNVAAVMKGSVENMWQSLPNKVDEEEKEKKGLLSCTGSDSVMQQEKASMVDAK